MYIYVFQPVSWSHPRFLYVHNIHATSVNLVYTCTTTECNAHLLNFQMGRCGACALDVQEVMVGKASVGAITRSEMSPCMHLISAFSCVTQGEALLNRTSTNSFPPQLRTGTNVLHICHMGTVGQQGSKRKRQHIFENGGACCAAKER